MKCCTPAAQTEAPLKQVGIGCYKEVFDKNWYPFFASNSKLIKTSFYA